MGQAVPQAVGERLLALVTPQASLAARRAPRVALGAAARRRARHPHRAWRPGASPSGDEREQLEALRRLGSLLGAQLLIEEGDDVAEVVARVARERGTHLRADGLAGGAQRAQRFSEPLAEQLLRRLPGVDLRIVADRSKREWTPR